MKAISNIKEFTHPVFGSVRTLVDEYDEPWFVGKDVAEVLGYESPRSAVSKKVDIEDRGVAKMETPSGLQEMTIINESGLYSLILSSKLPQAREFKHWVTSEVLPQIRKTGGYIPLAGSVDGESDAEIPIGQNRLFNWLRAHGYLFKKENRPCQEWVEKGYFSISESLITTIHHGTVIRVTTKVTGLGQQYFVNGFLSGKFKTSPQPSPIGRENWN